MSKSETALRKSRLKSQITYYQFAFFSVLDSTLIFRLSLIVEFHITVFCYLYKNHHLGREFYNFY